MMMKIENRFQFKKNNIDIPVIYLGGRLENKSSNVTDIWTITSRHYLKEIISNL